MKISLKLIMIAHCLLSLSSCNKQIKNTKTETVKISGNCEICKNTIQKAGNEKNVSIVEWNQDSKIATLSYDSLKTSKNEILKRIALVGYDNELYSSPDDTYEKLLECCHYVRTKKEFISLEKMEMVENNSELTKSEIIVLPKSEVFTIDYLTLVFDHYFDVKNALIQSDGNLTFKKAIELLKSLEDVKMNDLAMDVHLVWMKVMKDLKADASKMAKTKDISEQRKNFISLSNNMYSLLKVAKYETPVYYQHCPMANDGKGANWLSTENEIKNPYYGSVMLTCGVTVETIK